MKVLWCSKFSVQFSLFEANRETSLIPCAIKVGIFSFDLLELKQTNVHIQIIGAPFLNRLFDGEDFEMAICSPCNSNLKSRCFYLFRLIIALVLILFGVYHIVPLSVGNNPSGKSVRRVMFSCIMATLNALYVLQLSLLEHLVGSQFSYLSFNCIQGAILPCRLVPGQPRTYPELKHQVRN